MVPFQAGVGVTPPQLAFVASAPKANCTVPFAWVIVVGTTLKWHSEQAIGAERYVDWFTCATWTPTPRAVTAVFPFESAGGAAVSFASAPEMAVRVASP